MGNLVDHRRRVSMERCNWFDSNLCMLAPTNSMQLAAFERLRLNGLLCRRFSASVKKGRRFFTLAGDSEELPNGREETEKGEPKGQLQQLPASLAAPDPDGGSQVEAGVIADPVVGPEPSVAEVRREEESSPVPADKLAAATVAVEPAKGPAATRELPGLMKKPAAVRRESRVMNPAISSKVIVNMTQEGSVAAAEAAAPPKESEGPLPKLEGASVASRVVAELAAPPFEAAPGLAAPAAAQSKRKADAGEAGGVQKKKKSTPVGQ